MGLGKIGLPVATYIQKYYPVFGYDISNEAIIRAVQANIQASEKVKHADVYIIAVNTYYRNSTADMSAIESCCRKISQINKDALLCFESTLFVGTASRMAAEYGFDNVAVCPHRWWEDDQDNHGVRQLRILGAINEGSLKKARAFYEALEIPLHIVSSTELAEATKIAENAHRYIQIAYAEELKLIADKNGLNFEEWRSALNTKWNVDVPEARNGIGRECLPKDTEFLRMLNPDASLLRGAVEANANYIKSLVAAPLLKLSAH
jgi:nucleotide sugar dehydrogenase